VPQLLSNLLRVKTKKRIVDVKEIQIQILVPPQAPRARNVKAWANGPGTCLRKQLSAEGAGCGNSLPNMSRFQRLTIFVWWVFQGRCPWLSHFTPSA
jgi:hypothetical protein